ncbi:MAG: LysM peptidoglycan-binding domain-containing protein [Candidatus Hydrogenedentes bacterium]|nr:LysM peptidoglycan-binding domain-containing protein [Candidatus Hydrogenedentota bacterium]
MNRNAMSLRLAFGLIGLLLIAGCAGTGRDVHQFSPIPKAEVGSQSLDPVQPRSVTDLLREADKEFQAANVSQEGGDREAALRHYTKMLELLLEADLDPGIFYSLRSEFENILDTSTEHAKLYDDNYKHLFRPGAVAGSYGPLQIPFPLPEPVLQEIEAIQQTYPKNFQAGLNRSSRYVPYLRAQFRQAGMPEELAYLAMIESMYIPKIDSRAGAGGMWQFMPSTAQRYDLRQDEYIDERYDWQKATASAIQYLQSLYTMFDGNWPLAISSYNMGENGIMRLCDGNGGERDLWKLLTVPPACEKMPEETKKYYARFLATIIVASNPERYGFTPAYEAPEETVRIPVQGSFTLADLNRVCGLEAGTLERLNPHLIREMTPAAGECQVSVPVASRHQFIASLKRLQSGEVPAMAAPVQVASAPAPAAPAPSRSARAAKESSRKTPEANRTTHTVRRGETLGSIARKYKISNDDLLKENNLRSANRIFAGQKLRIPGSGDTKEDTPAPAQAPVELAKATPPAAPEPAPKAEPAPEPEDAPKSAPAPGAPAYTVEKGDTLYDIAKAHDVSVANLQKWNNFDKGASLRVGDKIYVSDPTARTYHEVASGENPSIIAAKYKVSTDDLLAWNNLSRNSLLRVGQKLAVFGSAPAPAAAPAPAPEPVQAAAPAPAADPAEVTHQVAKGESPYSIAKRYGVTLDDLLAWNKLTSSDGLQVGQSLVIRDPARVPDQPDAIDPSITLAADEPVREQGQPEGTTKVVHKVAKGDSPYSIAQQYKVKTDDVLGWNKLSKKSTLQVGDECIIYVPSEKLAKRSSSSSAAPAGAGTITHVVSSGHNPTNIAQRYGVKVSDLYKWNGWDKDHVLMPGDKVTVHK